MDRKDGASTYAWFWQYLDAPRGEVARFRTLASVHLPVFVELDQRLLGLEGLRVIDLRQASTEDELHVENLGYSISHIKRNFDAYGTEADAFPYALPDAMTEDERRYTVQQASKTAFQIQALKDGCLTAYNPRTGECVISQCSILLDEAEQPPYELPVIFYRFTTDREVFYIACHGTLGLRTLMFIPSSKLLIIGEPAYTDATTEIRLVEAFRRFILRKRAIVLPYLEAQEAAFNPQKAVVFKSTLNYSHQLLNDLSAIQRLIDCDEMKNIDTVLVGGVQFFGHLWEIFPEIAEQNVIELGSLSEISQYILEKKRFAIKIGYNFIQERLIQRIKALCMRRANSEFMARTTEIRARYWPIVWVTIRVMNRMMNRTIENQAEVLRDVIRRVAELFPRLGVIFDGFCLPENVTREYVKVFAAVIRGELAVSTEIERTAPKGVVAYNLIGRSMSESIVMSQIADVYLAHYGTLQHKAAWFSGKPGIEHGNWTVARIPHVLALSCENVMAPMVLPFQCVEDVPESGGSRGEIGNNYRVDPKVLAEHVTKLIESLGH